MTLDIFFRIAFAVMAGILAIVIVRGLATGVTGLGGRKVTKAETPRHYWGAIGMWTILGACLALSAAFGTRNTPFVAFGLFGGYLFQALVTGEFIWTGIRPYRRADGDRGYWAWVIFLSVMVALLGGLFLLNWLWPTAP